MPPKLEPLPPDHQVLSLRDLKHSDAVLGISKVGQKIAISVECLLRATIGPDGQTPVTYPGPRAFHKLAR